jgi:hypothetical protein
VTKKAKKLIPQRGMNGRCNEAIDWNRENYTAVSYSVENDDNICGMRAVYTQKFFSNP